MAELAPGTEVDGYRVIRTLGSGGMAHVYEVEHLDTGNRHALKLLSVRSEEARTRLVTEGRLQADLQHPGLVTVTSTISWKGHPGLIMDLVDGPSLRVLLEAGPLTMQQADGLCRQILEAVSVAHAQGVVHRDLKPENILLERHGNRIVPRIADFGIAKVLEDASGPSGLTMTHSALGTAGYMSPEQMDDASSVDVRADVFALGAVLYELVCGKPTFEGRSDFERMLNAHEVDYIAPREHVPELAQRMEGAIVGALQKDPSKRLGDASVLLKLWVWGQPPPEAVYWRPEQLAAISGTEESLVEEPPTASTQRRAVPWQVALAAVGLVLLGVAISALGLALL